MIMDRAQVSKLTSEWLNLRQRLTNNSPSDREDSYTSPEDYVFRISKREVETALAEDNKALAHYIVNAHPGYTAFQKLRQHFPDLVAD